MITQLGFQIISLKQNINQAEDSRSNVVPLCLSMQVGGELHNLIAKSGKFSQRVARTFFMNMMTTLKYIHGQGYVHLDLKPQNILLSNEFKLKIADFGLASPISGEIGIGIQYKLRGTSGYIAPEVLKGPYNGIKADIFSAGVILFYMHAGRKPFERLANDPFYNCIKSQNYQAFWKHASRKFKQPNYFSGSFKDLFQKMAAFNPNQRPSIDEILNHVWLSQATCTEDEMRDQFYDRQDRIYHNLTQTQIQQLQRANQILNLVNNAYGNQRGGDDSQRQFVEEIRAENNLERQLATFEIISKDDLVLNKDFCYILCSMKKFLSELKVNIWGDQDFDQKQIQDEDLLQLSEIIDDKSNKIMVEFKYLYGFQDEQTWQKLKMSVHFGKVEQQVQHIMRFQLQEGSSFYYRIVLNEINKKFSFAIQKYEDYKK